MQMRNLREFGARLHVLGVATLRARFDSNIDFMLIYCFMCGGKLQARKKNW